MPVEIKSFNVLMTIIDDYIDEERTAFWIYHKDMDIRYNGLGLFSCDQLSVIESLSLTVNLKVTDVIWEKNVDEAMKQRIFQH